MDNTSFCKVNFSTEEIYFLAYLNSYYIEFNYQTYKNLNNIIMTTAF